MATRTCPDERLRALANVLDTAFLDRAGPHGSLIFVAGPDDPAPNDPLQLGMKDLEGEHPTSFLLGFRAPAEWQVLGVVASGRSFRCDEPDPHKAQTTVVFLVDRSGACASLVRTADGPRTMPGDPVGTVPDALRRSLGIATPPPGCGTGVLFSTLWLDRLLDAAGTRDAHDVLASWDGVAALHPASSLHVGLRALPPTELARAAASLVASWPWARVRLDASRWAFPGDGDVSPDLAAWMDDGMFSRWVLGSMPPLSTLVHDLGPLVPDDLAEPMVSVIEASMRACA